MARRYFFYQYANDKNFDISKRNSLVGFHKTNDGLATKVQKLKQGDIIIIRNSNSKENLTFYGFGEVISKPYDQSGKPNSKKDLIWQEEINSSEIVYPIRVQVNFSPNFALDNLDNLSWEKFLKLNWKNKKGYQFDKKSLAVFFKGNFVEVDERFTIDDITNLNDLLGLNVSNQNIMVAHDSEILINPSRQDYINSRIIRDSSLTIKAKEICNYSCQICGKSILFPNGKKYVEAHHIIPLGAPHNGPDKIENIICVCPNHHVELDFGITKLTNQNFNFTITDNNKMFIDYHNNKICT